MSQAREENSLSCGQLVRETVFGHKQQHRCGMEEVGPSQPIHITEPHRGGVQVFGHASSLWYQPFSFFHVTLSSLWL